MKLFISWSGERSHKVALLFRDWLPNVLQAVEPYVSSEDVPKGAPWFEDISGELTELSFGIVCLTWDNQGEPWINFEAGAIAKGLGKTNVAAFLVDVPASELRGPLAHFQATTGEKEDLQKLLRTLNGSMKVEDQLTEERLGRAFEKWWPDFQSSLAEALEETATEEERVYRSERDLLEEVVGLSRFTADSLAGLASSGWPGWQQPQKSFFREVMERLFEKKLTERERKVLVLMYGLDDGEAMTPEQIGELLGTSARDVLKIRNRARMKLSG